MGNKLVVANDYNHPVLVSVHRPDESVDEKAVQISRDNKTNWYIHLKDLTPIDGNGHHSFRWFGKLPDHGIVTIIRADNGQILAESIKVPPKNIVLITEEGKIKKFEHDKIDEVVAELSDNED